MQEEETYMDERVDTQGAVGLVPSIGAVLLPVADEERMQRTAASTVLGRPRCEDEEQISPKYH